MIGIAFVTIANKQVNANLILAAEGCLPGQKGTVRLYLDARAALPFAGSMGMDNVRYLPAPLPDMPATVELIGPFAESFRQQWNPQPATMAAG